MTIIIALCIVLSSLVPFTLIILWSFAASWPYPQLLPVKWTLQWWQLLTASNISEAAVGSITVGLIVALLSVLLGVSTARCLAFHSFRFKRAVEIFIYAPLAVPLVSYIFGIHTILINLNLVDSYTGMILGHATQTLPYSVYMLKQIFIAKGKKNEEQARTLGATPIKAFLTVTLPPALPGIATVASFCFIVSMSQYLISFILGGGVINTMPIILFPLVENGERGPSSSISILFISICLISAFLIQRLGYIKLTPRRKKHGKP